MSRWIWQYPKWPQFTWDMASLAVPLSRTRACQGRLLGRGDSLGFTLSLEATAASLTQDAVATMAIEGETVDPQAVRSSVAKRLGMPGSHSRRLPREDGVAELLVDAMRNHSAALTLARLCRWQAMLFPKKAVPSARGIGRVRSGPVSVLSGRVNQPRVHFMAPPAHRLRADLRSFLNWFNKPPEIDGVIRSGVAHLWLVTLHPFEDGNGRVSRAVADSALAQDERTSTRLYSVSSQILAERNQYYAALEQTQRGALDITAWLEVYLGIVERAVKSADHLINATLQKAAFWQRHRETELNERQRKAIQRMLDELPREFEGGMSNRKYAALTRVSRATAHRELADLVAKAILRPRPARGRSTAYDLVLDSRAN